MRPTADGDAQCVVGLVMPLGGLQCGLGCASGGFQWHSVAVFAGMSESFSRFGSCLLTSCRCSDLIFPYQNEKGIPHIGD